MSRSEETRLVNFLLNALRRRDQLRRAIIEYKFENANSKNVKPDLLVYLVDKQNPYCYILFEIKKRTVLDIPRIQSQYRKYTNVNPNCFNSKIFPVPDLNLPVFVDSIYYDTPTNILNSIIRDIRFRDVDAIINYNRRGPQARIFQIFKHSNDPINNTIINALVDRSSSNKLWSRIILPFTLKDLEGIEFLDKSKDEIRIRNDFSSSIIISHLFTFILQRKRRGLKGKFHIDDFFDHLFSAIKGLANFGEEDKRGITRKLELFLQFACDICIKIKKKLIKISESERNYFIIIIKNTDNFVSRMEKIRKKLDKEIEKQKTQERMPDFF